MYITILLLITVALLGLLALAAWYLVGPHEQPLPVDTADGDRFESTTTERVAVVCMGNETGCRYGDRPCDG